MYAVLPILLALPLLGASLPTNDLVTKAVLGEASASVLIPALSAATTPQCSIYGSRTLNCYEGPGLSYTAAATVTGGHYYGCTCAAQGDDVNGNTNWDFFPNPSLPGGGCYVNQYYTTTPCANSTLPAC